MSASSTSHESSLTARPASDVMAGNTGVPQAAYGTAGGGSGKVAGVLRRSPGWWLQFLGAAHAGVGAILYRDALGDIARDSVINSVPDRGDKATAFWFLAAAPTLWLGGRLLRSAESTGDLDAQRVAGSLLTATGLVGAAAMPASGFWAVAVVGVAALRRSTRQR